MSVTSNYARYIIHHMSYCSMTVSGNKTKFNFLYSLIFQYSWSSYMELILKCSIQIGCSDRLITNLEQRWFNLYDFFLGGGLQILIPRTLTHDQQACSPNCTFPRPLYILSPMSQVQTHLPS